MLGLIAPHVLVNEMCWLAFKDAQDKAGAKEIALFDLLDSAECKHFKSQSNRQICKMLPPTSNRQQAAGNRQQAVAIETATTMATERQRQQEQQFAREQLELQAETERERETKPSGSTTPV